MYLLLQLLNCICVKHRPAEKKYVKWSLKHNLNLCRNVYAKSNNFVDIFCYPKQQCCPTHSSPNIVRTRKCPRRTKMLSSWKVQAVSHVLFSLVYNSFQEVSHSISNLFHFSKSSQKYFVIIPLFLVNKYKFNIKKCLDPLNTLLAAHRSSAV